MKSPGSHGAEEDVDGRVMLKGLLCVCPPPLQLSPKKTWEGFIGGFFSTVVFGFMVSEELPRALRHVELISGARGRASTEGLFCPSGRKKKYL